MVETVHGAMADQGLALMLDVEQRYTRDQALTAAKRLEPLGLTWFEAPLLDTDLEGYAELRRHTAIPILPAGNTVLDLAGVERGLAMGAWSAAAHRRHHRRRHHPRAQDHGARRGAQHHAASCSAGATP